MRDVSAAFSVCLAGCVGPKYHRPSVETPNGFKEQISSTTSAQWNAANPSDTLSRGKWWESFQDPRLNDLEVQISSANQNVKQAEAQYREATALLSGARSDYFPTVTTDPSVTRGANPSTNQKAVNAFTLPVTASWEPSLWGRVGYEVKNAKASAQASAADLENARLSMQAELAVDYFNLETLDMEIEILNQSNSDDDKALQLTKARFNGGVASQADVAQAQTQLDSSRAQATDLAITRAQYEHAIAVLIGRAPSSLSLSTAAVQGLPPMIPAALPAQLLERRPDIASAERQVAAANANIGLARTAYFPALTLTATVGYEAANSADWFSWSSRFWAIGASAFETIFDFGRHRAQNRQARAAYDATVAAYRQTVLSAFQDVEDDLAAIRLLSEEGLEQDSAAKNANQSLTLEQERYKSGIVSYLDVITTENIALTNRRAAVEVLGRRMTAAIALIRALGGGWKS